MKYYLILLIVLLSTFSIAQEDIVNYPLEEEISTRGSFDQEIESSIKPLTFAQSALTAETERSCRLLRKGPIYQVKTGGQVSTSHVPGTVCNSGEFVRFLRCTGNTCSSSSDLFQHLWYKSAITDNINLKNYDVKLYPDFWSTYACYSCSVSRVESTYTCYNGQWRGEPGTGYTLSGSCPSGQCKQSSISDNLYTKGPIEALLCTDLRRDIIEPPMPPPPIPSPVPCINCGGGNPLSGSWSNIKIPAVVETGKMYEISASFTAAAAGNYYLEAGTQEEPKETFSTVIAQGSKCDADQHWAGEFVYLQQGESVGIRFQLQGRGAQGVYPVVVGAYSACGEQNKIVAVGGEVEFQSQEEVQPPSRWNPIWFIVGGLIIIGFLLWRKR